MTILVEGTDHRGAGEFNMYVYQEIYFPSNINDDIEKNLYYENKNTSLTIFARGDGLFTLLQ